MDGLSNGVVGALLDRSELPEYAAHHGAKHGLLREYANAWLPKLGFSYPNTAIVDGFASAGRYREGNIGSPLLLLHAYIGRSDQHRFRAPPHFIFIESKRSFAGHLRAEIDALGDLKGAQVDVIHRRYEKHFPRVIDYLAATYQAPLPVFAFVDPRGYKDTPFELIRHYRRRLGDKAEAMVYLPVNFMARFVMTDLTDKALQRAFGGREAIERVRQNPDAVDQQAGARMASEYADLMRQEYDLVTDFTVDPVRHNEYYLFFGTGSEHGVREMKRAYWKVDPVGGSGYQQDPQVAAGQGTFFGAAEVTQLPHEETLPALLRMQFGSHVFSIEEAERWTLLHTRFLDSPHLRQNALIPLQAAGKLQVIETTRRREIDFPPGTTMRFVGS
jgi:three-Cys-motif partner protein